MDGVIGPMGADRGASLRQIWPMSSAQARVWYVDEVAGGDAPNNLCFGLHLEGELDCAALELALHYVVNRHETLRTTFDLHEGEFVQTIHPVLRPVLDISGCSEQEAYARAMQSAREPFDLRRGPLVRVLLLRISPRRQILVVTVHHIVADAWSLGLFIDELAENYAAFAARREPRLLPLQVQYADYAKWQREWLKGAEAERQLASWRAALADAPSPRDETPAADFAGASRAIRIPHALLPSLKRFDATPYTVFLALLAIVLWQRAGARDGIIGIAVAGRNSVETEPVIGLFANLLPVRTVLSPDEPFATVLHRVRDAMLHALSHQELPFERLVAALQPHRHKGRNPLFDVLFVAVKAAASARPFGPLQASPYPLESHAAPFELSVSLVEETDVLCWLRAEFRTSRYTGDQVVALLEHCLLLAGMVVARPMAAVAELPRASAWETANPRAALPLSMAEPPAALLQGGSHEDLIAGEWEAALGVPVAARDVSFFDLGGHSLKLVAMAASLGRALGRKVPISLLLEEPTVSGMARRIEGGWSPVSVQPIQTRGARIPFFCSIPNVTVRDLALALGSDQPLYLLDAFGLQERRLLAGEALLTSVTDVAAVFVADMLRIWPEGPFLLGGMCDGGIFALEAALQLQALGRPVALLAQFDTPVRGYFRKRHIYPARLRRICRLIANGQIKDELRQRLAALQVRLAPVRAAEDPYERVWTATWRMLRAWRPARRFEGRVEFFQAVPTQGFADVTEGWAARASEGLRVHAVGGTHSLMLAHPPAQQLIAQILKEAQRR